MIEDRPRGRGRGPRGRAGAAGGGGGGAVSSVFGRTGAVVAATSDYDATQIDMSASSRILGRVTAGAGVVEELTGTQATGLLDAASTTARGTVELATDAETQTGTDSARAVTPASGAAAWIKREVLTTAGDLLTASGASTPARLGIGSEGQFLGVVGGALAWTSLPSVLAVLGDVWLLYADICSECVVDLAVSGSLSAVS